MKKISPQNFSELIENEFGDLFTIEEIRNSEKIRAISTGAISLDVSTGIGGIPLGRFTEMFGIESVGKTSVALCVARKAIENKFKVLYIDAENGLDWEYIHAIVGNFDKNLFSLYQPELMEHALKIAEAGILSNEFGLIVLDSIGGLVPGKVKEDNIEDRNVALLSRMLTTFTQRNIYPLRKSGAAFLGINQVRDNIGAYVHSYITPGGHTWKHVCSLRIQLSRPQDIEQAGEKIGVNVQFVIKKNKLGPPFRTFTLPLLFGKGIDFLRDLVEFASMLGVLDKAGPYYKFEGQTLGSGLVKTCEYLEKHSEIVEQIIAKCYSGVQSYVVKDEIALDKSEEV